MYKLIIPLSSQGLYRLTLAEIIYHIPDHKDLLQAFVWQEYDYVPDFPNLMAFLKFWDLHIEGKLYQVNVSVPDSLMSSELHYKISL